MVLLIFGLSKTLFISRLCFTSKFFVGTRNTTDLKNPSPSSSGFTLEATPLSKEAPLIAGEIPGIIPGRLGGFDVHHHNKPKTCFLVVLRFSCFLYVNR